MTDALQGVLGLIFGFALIRIGMYVIRMYERAFEPGAEKLLASSSIGSWAGPFTIGVVCIWTGVVAMLVGGIMALLGVAFG